MAALLCPSCHATLDSTLVCLECGALRQTDDAAASADDNRFEASGPFGAFGLEVGYDVDAAVLRKRLLKLQRAMHPDFFATRGPEARRAAEDATARLNKAFEILSDERQRAEWLLRHCGGPSQEDERQMPREFLMEVLEWNELLEEARGTPNNKAALASLHKQLVEARVEALKALRGALTPLPEHESPNLARARQRLNALRYVDRAIEEIERPAG